jgi:hypothetical protein
LDFFKKKKKQNTKKMSLSDPVTIVLIGAAGTALGLCIRYSLKSKCSNVKCCFGLINIERDTDAEVRAEIALSESSPRAGDSSRELAASPQSPESPRHGPDRI